MVGMMMIIMIMMMTMMMPMVISMMMVMMMMKMTTVMVMHLIFVEKASKGSQFRVLVLLVGGSSLFLLPLIIC